MPSPLSRVPPRLDHVVISTKDDLDAAAALYRRLGFALTERGHHSKGTTNHLAIFGETYLELLGYPAGQAGRFPALAAGPVGLNALVFKPPATEDFVDQLRQGGAQFEEPSHFFRPVRHAGGEGVARFATATLRDSRLPSGRIFFCRHFTPELVWREEWRGHPNGVTDVGEFVFSAADPVATAGIFGDLFGAELVRRVEGGVAVTAGRAEVLVLTPSFAAARLGGDLPRAEGMAALGLRVRALGVTRRLLSSAGVGFSDSPGRVVVPAAEASGVALAFFE